ncbi:hypothetical protein ACFYOD_07350 [Streptomyces sp. NPDC006703]|uniref:hypothetical protein n=1 Tax=Streptomyces sp. NPDC006703 TaxID=3364759 RepID=UPI0036C425E6
MRLGFISAALRRLAVHELRVFAGFGLWITGRRHQVRPSDRAFGYAAPQAATVYGLTFVCVVETVGVSFMVRDWPTVHAALLVFDLYTVLLVLGMQAAAVTRPHVLSVDTLRLRRGAQVDLTIPLAHIISVRKELRFPDGKATPQEVLDLSVGSQTSLTVELTEPVTHVRLLGKRQQVRTVRFHADEAGELVTALRAVVAQGGGLRRGRTGPSRCPGRPG